MSYATVPPFAPPVRNVGAPLAVIVGLGTLVALLLSLLTAADPGGTALGFGLASAAMGLVLGCYLWLDRWEPEPPRLLIMAFLWGASVAVLLSLALEALIGMALPVSGVPQSGPEPRFALVAVGAPLVEEAAKGLFLLVMMTGRRRHELNTLTDCLVYGGFVAVGFAWIENIFYIASGETLTESLTIAGLRLVLGPFAHPLFTTMFALGVWAALRQRGIAATLACLLLGYAAAAGVHALWNGSALRGAQTYLGVYVLWLMPIFALAVALAIGSRRRERRVIAGQLPDMVAGGLLSPAEAGWLASLPSRRGAVGAAQHFGGRAAATAVKRFIVDAVELAYVRDRIARGFGDPRVLALHDEEVARLTAARAVAGPVLAQAAPAR